MLSLYSILKAIYGVIFFRTGIGEILTALHSNYLHLRFSFSDTNPGTEKTRLEYYLVKHCHIVEKGLALPNPRMGFGQSKILDLIDKTNEYEMCYGTSQIGSMVRSTLHEYVMFHEKKSHNLPVPILRDIKTFIGEDHKKNTGGLKFIKKATMATYDGRSFENFLSGRHSIRNFSRTPVNDDVIRQAISICRNTPSVCNRQGWKIHYYSDKNNISKLLTFQNGNSGFTNSIDKLLIVTCNTKAFTRYEHNQLFVDGGLVSMNLMLALHSLGLGSCPLNTCMPWFRESQLKKTAAIPRHERLIMMVAVGNLLDEFSVARSQKYTVDKILSEH